MIQREANSRSRCLAIGFALCALLAWGAGRGGAQPAPAGDSQSGDAKIQQHQEKMQQVLQEKENAGGDAKRLPSHRTREDKIREHRERIRQIMTERRDLGNPKTLAAIREKAATGHPYRIGEVAMAAPRDNQAVRFAFADKPYGIQDILVFPDTAKQKMYVFVVFDDETFDGRSADMTTSKTLGFGLRQKPAVQVYLKWEPNDGRTDLWFQAKANDAFGEEVAKLHQIAQRDGLDQAIPPPDEDVDPKERGRIIQEAIQKRRDVQARLSAQIEALKKQYDMGPGW